VHKTNFTKIVILIVCFVAAAAFVQSRPDANIAVKKRQLQDALANIPEWNRVGSSPLDDRIVQVLELDDYVSQNYSNGNHEISLYIGYYLSTKKVGAAHDPLVCMPGQGWTVLDEGKGEVVLENQNRERISYSSMMLQKGGARQLVVYWFQAYDTPAPSTFKQKLFLLYRKLLTGREDNAFVRISTFLDQNSIDESYRSIFQFVGSFYPDFMNYVTSGA